MQTLVIGIDGGEWDVIRPMMRAGELPNLSSIVENGYAGDLKSVVPPVSPPAWMSIHTGTNPGKHGIFDFVRFDEEHTRRWVSSTDRQSTPFWRILNDNGVETGLFKLPLTYPPDDVSGFMVSGFPTPNSATDFVAPRSLGDTVGKPKQLFEKNHLQQSGDWISFKDDLIEVAEHQTDVFLDLVNEHDAEFYMTVYDGADRMQHFYWHYFDESHPGYESETAFGDPIREYYRTVDNAIGKIQREFDSETNIVVVSDHGFGPLTHDVNVDEWLAAEGFLTRESGTGSRLTRRAMSRAIETTWRTLMRLGLDAAALRILPDGVVQEGREMRQTRTSDIDWDQTKAFFTTVAGQAIVVNRVDEFIDGAVTDAEYDEVIEALRAALRDIVDPETGERIVEAVHHRDDIWDGWAVSDGPDLIVETDPRYSLKGGRADELVTPSTRNGHYRSGDHRRTGIFAATGPAFGTGEAPTIHLTDIAPTLLYLHRCPIPTAMDGRVIESLFTDSARADRSIEETSEYGRDDDHGHDWTGEQSEEIEDRLRDLGYVE